jgi:hypothetical protein
MSGSDPTKPHQSPLDTEHLAHSSELSHLPQPTRHHSHQRHQRGSHSAPPAAKPTLGTRQLTPLDPQRAHRRLDSGGFRSDHRLLDVIETAGVTRRQTVRQQAKGLMRPWAVPPRHTHPPRLDPRVRAMTCKPTTALGVDGTPIEPCLGPGLLGKVLLAGQRRLVTQLHRPRARTPASVASPLSLFSREFYPARSAERAYRRGRMLLLTLRPSPPSPQCATFPMRPPVVKSETNPPVDHGSTCELTARLTGETSRA